MRRDGDDAYLVVAADKGTATFSDIANEVAESYGFWLGDAFASGGSVGYDHKAMGITAKGAWEAVKRHFREMGVDTQSEDFTVVGVGDMSGDVFGNGMLLSKHIRLFAAFDHRHIFIDPNPDAATSWDERKRLFDLPRSSWEDYDRSLISEGGGVYSREQKSIPISPQARAALGIADGVEEMTPPALIKAILKAPADLLFNGGIGTYIKAETESDADVGDRANDPVRVNGNQVRAKVIGEGGNLGVTSLGRIEFNLAGGRFNTDAMDNSAGVDCSDHEVNIKILIDSLVTAGKVRAEERTAAAGVDDRRGRPAGAGRQRGSERSDGHQPRQRGQPAAGACAHDQGLRQGPRAQPRTRGVAVGEGDPPPHRSRDRSDVTGTRDADGPRQAGAEGRGARQRSARPGGVRLPAAVVLPVQAARPVRRRHPPTSAAPRDRHHHAGQRSRRHQRHHATPTGSPRTSASDRSTRYAATSPPMRSSGSARCGGRSAPPATTECRSPSPIG